MALKEFWLLPHRARTSVGQPYAPSPPPPPPQALPSLPTANTALSHKYACMPVSLLPSSLRPGTSGRRLLIVAIQLYISWRCPRRCPARLKVQFLSLCGQDLQLAGGRRRLHDAPERGIMLTIFFVRTEFLPNRLRCTAILAALQADEEAESGRSGSQGGAFAFKKIRPRPRHHRDRRHPL